MRRLELSLGYSGLEGGSSRAVRRAGQGMVRVRGEFWERRRSTVTRTEGASCGCLVDVCFGVDFVGGYLFGVHCFGADAAGVDLWWCGCLMVYMCGDVDFSGVISGWCRFLVV